MTPLASYAAGTTYWFDVEFDPVFPPWNCEWTPDAVSTPQDFVDALNDAGNWPNLQGELPFHAALDADSGKVVFTVLETGAAGNVYQVQPNTAILDTEYIQFSGGADGVELAYEAGLSGFEYSSTLGGGGLRVVYTYGFILGGAAGA